MEYGQYRTDWDRSEAGYGEARHRLAIQSRPSEAGLSGACPSRGWASDRASASGSRNVPVEAEGILRGRLFPFARLMSVQ